MSKQEAVLKFFEEAKTNANLRAALAEAGDSDGVIEVAKQFGYDFGLSDITAAKEAKYGAVDDASISSLSGGAGIERTSDPMRYWGTPRWREYWGARTEGHE